MATADCRLPTADCFFGCTSSMTLSRLPFQICAICFSL
jgi:hypothetical protein